MVSQDPNPVKASKRKIKVAIVKEGNEKRMEVIDEV
jgi:hypothetical protein